MITDPTRPNIPDELRRLMAEMGPRWGKDASPAVSVRHMTDAFSAVHATMPDETSTLTRDIPYGNHPRQCFDLFRPKHPVPGCALVIFVHGGAFVEGHRNRTDQIYANVGRYFARHGLVAINMGYRMAPETRYPGGTQDVAAVVAWAHAHAGELGIDPARIFLMGHSAGGAHAGSYAYDRRHQPEQGHGLAGLIIVSGRMRIETQPDNPNADKVRAYYGDDQYLMDRVSPVSLVDADSLPTFIAIAEFENPLIDMHCLELAFRLAEAKRQAPPMIWLAGHNHTSGLAHLNTSEDTLGQALLGFIAGAERT